MDECTEQVVNNMLNNVREAKMIHKHVYVGLRVCMCCKCMREYNLHSVKIQSLRYAKIRSTL